VSGTHQAQSSPGPGVIGAGYKMAVSATGFFKGAVEEMPIYDRALASKEVRNLFNLNLWRAEYATESPSGPCLPGRPLVGHSCGCPASDLLTSVPS
jgi:hypothetical protein